MKHSHFVFACIIVLSALLTESCTPTFTGNIYTFKNPQKPVNDKGYGKGDLAFAMQANHMEAPFLSEKGDLYIKAGFNKGTSLAFAYATGEKFGIYAKLADNNFSDKYSDYTYAPLHVDHYENDVLTSSHDTIARVRMDGEMNHSQFIFEFGGGFFKKVNQYFHHELWSGLGVGSASTDHALELSVQTSVLKTTLQEKRNLLQYNVQYTAGFKGKGAEISLMNRFEVYGYYNQSFKVESGVKTYSMKNFSYVYRPGIRGALGWKKFLFYMQYEALLPLADDAINWQKEQFTFGAIVRLNLLKK